MASMLNQIDAKIYTKIGFTIDKSIAYRSIEVPIYRNVANKIQPLIWNQVAWHTSRTVQINYDKTTTIRNYKTTNT